MAFAAYAISFPNECLCLVDTYDTLESGIARYESMYFPIPFYVRMRFSTFSLKRCQEFFDCGEGPPFVWISRMFGYIVVHVCIEIGIMNMFSLFNVLHMVCEGGGHSTGQRRSGILLATSSQNV